MRKECFIHMYEFVFLVLLDSAVDMLVSVQQLVLAYTPKQLLANIPTGGSILLHVCINVNIHMLGTCFSHVHFATCILRVSLGTCAAATSALPHGRSRRRVTGSRDIQVAIYDDVWHGLTHAQFSGTMRAINAIAFKTQTLH